MAVNLLGTTAPAASSSMKSESDIERNMKLIQTQLFNERMKNMNEIIDEKIREKFNRTLELENSISAEAMRLEKRIDDLENKEYDLAMLSTSIKDKVNKDDSDFEKKMENIRSKLEEKLQHDCENTEQQLSNLNRNIIDSTSSLKLMDRELLKRFKDLDNKNFDLSQKHALLEVLIEDRFQTLMKSVRSEVEKIYLQYNPTQDSTVVDKIYNKIEQINKQIDSKCIERFVKMESRIVEVSETLTENLNKLISDSQLMSNSIFELSNTLGLVRKRIATKLDETRFREMMENRFVEFRDELQREMDMVRSVQQNLLRIIERNAMRIDNNSPATAAISSINNNKQQIISLSNALDEKVNKIYDKFNDIEQRVNLIILNNPKLDLERINQRLFDIRSDFELYKKNMSAVAAKQ